MTTVDSVITWLGVTVLEELQWHTKQSDRQKFENELKGLFVDFHYNIYT